MIRRLAPLLLVAALAFGLTLLLRPSTEPAPAPAPLSDGPLRPPSYQLRLVDSAGAPVAECAASLWQIVRGGRRLTADSNRSCAGGLRWQGLSPGERRLMAQAPGAALVDRRFTLAADQRLDDGDVVLAPGGDVAGELRDEQGPAAGAWVWVLGLDREGYKTDKNGMFRFPGLPVGEWRLRALRARQVASATVTVDAAAQVSASLRLVTAGIFGFKLSPAPHGYRVDELKAGGGAEACGVVPGDLLTAIDGVSVSDSEPDALDRLLADAPGTTAALSLGEEGRVLRCERRAL